MLAQDKPTTNNKLFYLWRGRGPEGIKQNGQMDHQLSSLSQWSLPQRTQVNLISCWLVFTPPLHLQQTQIAKSDQESRSNKRINHSPSISHPWTRVIKWNSSNLVAHVANVARCNPIATAPPMDHICIKTWSQVAAMIFWLLMLSPGKTLRAAFWSRCPSTAFACKVNE